MSSALPSKSDPEWVAAEAIVAQMQVIRMMYFVGRLNSIVLFADIMLDLYNRHGAPALKAQMMAGLPDVLSVLKFQPEVLEEEQKKIIEKIKGDYEREANKPVEQPREYVINQSLVMIVTIFDTFLEELLDAIFRAKPKLLLSAAEEKSIELKDIMRCGSYDAVIDSFRNKEISRFGREGVKKRFSYLTKKTSLDLEKAIKESVSIPAAKGHFDTWTVDTLADIYERRHDIVHRSELPIRDVTEVKDTREFLNQMIFHLSVQAKEVHNVLPDVTRDILLGDLYRKFKAEGIPGSPPPEPT